MQTLDALAKRGKLPGYQPLTDTTFRADAFGSPFDADLLVTITSTDPCAIDCSLRLRRRMPILFAIVTILTIWPGVLITDSLIPGEWGWWPTAYWYYPLTIVPIPFLVVSMSRKTRASIRRHAREQIATITKALDATATGPAIEPHPASSPG